MLTGSAFNVAPFGNMPDGQLVESFTLTNASGMEVCFISLGGIITSIKVPDRDGKLADVTLGYDELCPYLENPHYFGALIGRYANRIADGHFVLDGKAYSLATNDGENSLHSGPDGFHSIVWDVEPFDRAGAVGAILRHVSPNGHGGFPGTLQVRVTYTLTDDDELVFEYHAVTDVATPVSLMQHFYLNLAGHDAGSVLQHELQVNASRYIAVDDELIPTRQVLPVQGTPLDFREPRVIADALETSGELRHTGFDHCYALDTGTPAARLTDPASGRSVDVETTEPGLQFYSGGQLTEGIKGKEGAFYGQFGAVALETQRFPDSPNVPSFPSAILRPGEEYVSRTMYRFSRR
jgi:aldose 1-epimerase